MKAQFFRLLLGTSALNAASGVASLFIVFVAMGHLDPSSYVIFSTLLAVSSAFLNLDGLQKPLAYLLSSAKNSDNFGPLLNSAVKISRLIAIFSAAGAALTIVLYIKERLAFSPTNTPLAIITGSTFLFVLFTLLNSPRAALDMANTKVHKAATVKAITNLLSLGALWVLVKNQNLKDFYPLSLAIGAVVAWLAYANISPIPHHQGASFKNSANQKELWRSYRSGILFNISVFAAILVERFLTSFFLEIDEAAKVTPSLDISGKLLIIHSVFNTVMLSFMLGNSGRQEYDRHAYWRYGSLYIRISFLISCAIYFSVPAFFHIAGKNPDTLNIYSMQILSFVFFVNAFGHIGYNSLVTQNKFVLISRVYVATPVLLAISGAILIQGYSAQGFIAACFIARLSDIALCLIALAQDFRGEGYKKLTMANFDIAILIAITFLIASPLNFLSSENLSRDILVATATIALLIILSTQAISKWNETLQSRRI